MLEFILLWRSVPPITEAWAWLSILPGPSRESSIVLNAAKEVSGSHILPEINSTLSLPSSLFNDTVAFGDWHQCRSPPRYYCPQTSLMPKILCEPVQPLPLVSYPRLDNCTAAHTWGLPSSCHQCWGPPCWMTGRWELPGGISVSSSQDYTSMPTILAWVSEKQTNMDRCVQKVE